MGAYLQCRPHGSPSMEMDRRGMLRGTLLAWRPGLWRDTGAGEPFKRMGERPSSARVATMGRACAALRTALSQGQQRSDEWGTPALNAVSTERGTQRLPNRNEKGEPLCFRCKKYGHMKRDCRATIDRQVNAAATVDP